MKHFKYGKLLSVLCLMLCVLCLVLAGCSKKDDGGECKHENTEVKTTDAGCETVGKKQTVCKDCSAVISEEEISAVGHKWSIDAAKSTQATCTAEGANVFACASCDKTKSEPTAKIAHNYLPDETLSEAAACTEGGKEVTKCSFCGTTDTIETSAIGHNIVTEWVYTGKETPKAGESCVVICERTAECKNCGTVTESDEKTKHNYVFGVKTEATCSKAGEKAYICDGCGAVQGETTVPYTVEHSWNSGTQNGEYKLYACSKCDATRKEFSGTQATVKSEDLDSEIKLGDTVISMDSAASDKLGASNATLAANGYKKDEIPSTTPGLDKVGADDTVYNLSLTKKDGTPITDFGSGKVTVKLPYTLKEGEDPASITIFYLDPVDGVVIIEGAVYHDGYVTFETNHFSYYMVGRYTVKEICEKYGHNWFVSEREASCTESGFNLTVCTRCREKAEGYTPFIPALGHADSAPVEEKQAGCTENGYKKYQCSRCNNSHTEIIYAEGHEWNETSKVESTCTTAGYTEYVCASCSENKFEYGEKLPHDFKSETVAATCTEGGYTQKTCNVCGLSEKDNVTLPLGHKWNVEAANCGVGQVCTVCGAAGEAATGEHNMVGGVCTVCGDGCEHDYKLTDEKIANCTEGGYKKYTCSKCRSEKTEDYTEAVGHNYEGGKCTVCGEGAAVDTAFVENLLNSITSGDRTMTVSGLTVYAKNKYTADNRVEIESVVKIDFSQAIISVKNGVGTIYGKADVKISNDKGATFESQSAEVYGDGSYMYIKTTDNDNDSMIIRYSYDYISAETNGGDASTGAISGILVGMSGIFGDSWMDEYKNMTDDERAEFCKLFDSVFDKVFVDKGNNTYLLNLAGLKEISDSFENDTVAEFIEKYFGEGSYQKLKDEVLASGSKTIEDFYTMLIEYAEANGQTEDAVVSMVEEALAAIAGSEIDLKEMLKDEQFAGMTLEAILEQMIASIGNNKGDVDVIPPVNEEMHGVDIPIGKTAVMSADEPEFNYTETMTSLFEMFEQGSLYEILFAGDEFVKNVIVGIIDKLADESVCSITLTTESTGTVKSFVVKLNDFEATVGGSYGSVSGNETPTEFKLHHIVNITGEMKFEMKASVPASAAALKTEYDQMAAKVWNSIKNQCAGGPLSVVCNSYGTLGIFTKNPNGTLSLKIYGTKYSGNNNFIPDLEGGVIEIPDVTLVGSIDISNDCSGAYRIYISGEVLDPEYGYEISRNIYFVINPINGYITGASQHNYVEYHPTDLPAGTPTSPDMVECEQAWYSYEKCKNCGEVVRNRNQKWHEESYSYKLPAGFTNCEYDGYTVVVSCSACGEHMHEYESNSHWSEAFRVPYTYNTPHGTMTVYAVKCPCGLEQSFEYRNYDEENGCVIGWDSTDFEPIMSGDKQIGYREKQYCAIDHEGIDGPQSQCTFYMLYEYYFATDSETTCERKSRTVYTFYNNGVQVGEKVTVYDIYYSHKYKDNIIINTDTHFRNESVCMRCGAENISEDKRDSVGRVIYEYRLESENGRVVYEYHYRYVYESLTSCYCTRYYRDYLSMNEERLDSTGEEHSYTYENVIPGTCTQAPLYYEGCKICGTNGVYRYEEPRGHRWDWNGEFYYCYECGLESVSANSFISMEDLSDHKTYGGMTDKYVVGFYDYKQEPLNVYFTFVKNDGSGESFIVDFYDYSFENFEYNGEYYYHQTLLYINRAAVEDAAASMGISLRDYDFGITLHHETASADQQELFCTLVLTDLA